MESLRSDSATRAFVLVALIVAGAAFCIGEPIWQLLVNGPFAWHIHRAEFWQGGLEVLVLAALLAGAATMASARWRLVLLLVPAEFYLRRHYVDLPLLVDVLYLEVLIGLGALASRWSGMPPARDAMDYLRCAVAGIVLWSLGAWILSAFGIGSLRALRIYTVALAVPVVLARQAPLCVFLWRRMGERAAVQRAGLAVLGAWFLCLMARTNVMQEYDAWWYGFRGEFVLVGAGSVFASPGLVAPVHYYPKLFELLLIPVSALGDTSVILGVSILVLALFGLAASEFLKRLQLGFGARLALVALCLTLPAVANSALSPKPDLFCGWLLLLACVTAMRYARDGMRSDGAWTLALCLLACASKLSAPPYAFVLIAVTLWSRYRRSEIVQSDPPAQRRFAMTILVSAAIVCALVTWRTWALAGVPLIGPQQIVELFAKFGMTLKPPVGLLEAGPPFDASDVPALLTDLLFRPQNLKHIVIAWTGNVWLYLFALASLAWMLRTRSTRESAGSGLAIAFAVFGVGLVLLLCFRTSIRGGDGSYFILPMSVGILLGGALAVRNLPQKRPQRFLLCLLPAFALFQAAYCFASAGWAMGTRTFDFDLTRSVHDTKFQRRRMFRTEGIERTAEILRKAHGSRAVGYVRHGLAFRLQTSFEHLAYYQYWYRAPLADPESFVRTLRDERIDYLILPKPEAATGMETIDPVVAQAAELMARDPAVQVIDDRRFVLYDLSARHAKDARCAKQDATASAPADGACVP